MNEFYNEISGLSPQKLKLLCLELRAQLDTAERRAKEPIAVIGMGCRFPGNASDPEAFWRLMSDGTDAIDVVPAERWDLGLFYDDDPEAPGKMYTREGGFLHGVDQFDPHFFDISPREAVNMDPQQRLLLEVTWEALEHAGQAPSRLAGSKTGVYVGIFLDDYAKLQMRFSEPSSLNAYTGTGNTFSVAAGRIAYLLGVHGPCLALDTACSSSLVAVHLACQSLRSGESDMALAGGVNLILSPDSSIFLCKAKALSPDGRCKTFDAAADGYSRAEGCGVVVLKRLSDALAQRDNVLAVIRGSAVNHDGPSSGLTVPNGPAQVAVIREALASGNVAPEQVSYIEAHGTGTALGDPIEVKALSTVFGPRTRQAPLLIGSVKTNIGHAESAAGVAGLIKLVLSLQHRELPPHLHFKSVNPHIRLEDGGLQVVTERTAWQPNAATRVAGVSSFGLSGTNAHLVVEEAPLRREIAESGRPLQILTLSAKSAPALLDIARRFDAHLEVHPEQSLADVCYTANSGRAHFSHRLAVVGSSTAELRAKLGGFLRGDEHAAAHAIASWDTPKVAFLFTGQGSQYAGMARALWDGEPTFRAIVERCDAVARPYLGQSLFSVMDGPLLDQTAFTQPALFALECALAEVWKSWGVLPSYVLGHSIGEYAAAYVAGIFSLEDGMRLVLERAQLMQAQPLTGAMVAVFADEARVLGALRGFEHAVSIAAVNAPDNVVLSGERGPLERVIEQLTRAGIASKPLAVSHAFHSPLMEPVCAEFEAIADGVRYAVPTIGIVSNLSATLVRDGAMSRARYWRRQLREPVRFLDGLQTLRREGCEVYLEVGPAPVLTALGRRSIAEQGATWIPCLRRGQNDWEQMLQALAQLHVRGVAVDWERHYANQPGTRVPLPTYPWQRKHYWVDWGGRELWRDAPAPNAPTGPEHPVLGRTWSLPGSLAGDHVWERELDAADLPYAADHRIAGMSVLPVAVFLEWIHTAGRALDKSDTPFVVEDVQLHKPLYLQSATRRALQISLRRDGAAKRCSVHSRAAGDERGEWTLHVTSRLREVQL